MDIVSDTSPLNYLLQIDAIELLPALFGEVALPQAVRCELLEAGAPAIVRSWASALPDWAVVLDAVDPGAANGHGLGVGEVEAIGLARERHAKLLLCDDRAPVTVARSLGLDTLGTIGVLVRAARRGMVRLDDALTALGKTNFRRSPTLLSSVLARELGRR